MHPIALFLAICWTVPALLRTWRMARFYQIEEYKTDRYLNWLTGKRERWFPKQPAIAMLVGVIIAAIFQIADVDSVFGHLALWLLVCVIVGRPEPVKETKKEFVRTQRGIRILATAFAVDTLLVLGLSQSAIRSIEAETTPQEISTVAINGFLIFLLSPLALIVGNWLMYPIDAILRQGFRRKALQRLQAANPVVIGVTGSYGKTSTKHYLAHILGGRYKVYATPKSYNTEMGICLAINNDLDPAYGFEYFITEMGAYIPGEIERIVKLTKPTMSIVTAVGPMHFERFKSFENIVKAKYEIVEGLPQDGTCFFNGDNPYVLGMAERGYPDHRIIVSQEGLSQARFVAENVTQSLAGLAFEVVDQATGDRHPFKTVLLGTHNVTNILLATAVAREIGLSLGEIGLRVATLEPTEHRLNHRVLQNGITIIDDAYSANPVGAANALDVLKLHQTGRRIVITPGMVELGELQTSENFKLGQKITEVATDVVLVGIEQTRPINEGVASTAFDQDHLLIMDTFEEARQWFQAQVQSGDAVLFLNDLPDTYF